MRKIKGWHIFILVTICTLVPYFESVNGDFVFDDIPLIVTDPFYTAETNPLQCWNRSFWKESRQQGLYRPVTILTYWVNVKVHGLKSAGFRLVNIILHIGVCILAYLLARRLMAGKAAAVVAVLIFAVHPIHSEAVAPAFGRGELLCAFFFMAGLLFHIRAGRSRFYLIPAATAFLLSCWSKEHAVVFLPVCIMMDLYLGRLGTSPFKNFVAAVRQSLLEIFSVAAPVPGTATAVATTNSTTETNALLAAVRKLRYCWIYVLVLAIYFASRLIVLGTFLPAKDNFEPGIDNPIAVVSPALRFVSALRIQGNAIKLLLWPDTLSHDYSFAQIRPSVSFADPGAIVTLALFIFLPFLLAKFIPRMKRKIIFFWCTYLICILPAGNFIVSAGTIFAERLIYLPSLWIILLFSCILMDLFRRFKSKIPVFIIIALLISACAARSFVRIKDWNSEMSLAVAGIKTAPSSAKIWNNLAIQLETIGNLEEAVSACDKAIGIYPRYATAWANRGTYLARLGRFEEAEHDLRYAISLHKKHIQAYYNLGALLANLGRIEEAKAVWEKSLENAPDQPELRKELLKLKGKK